MSRLIKSLILSIAMLGVFGVAEASAKTATIQAGETLGMHFPDTWDEIGVHYGINPHLVYPGQVYSDDFLQGSVAPSTAVLGVSTTSTYAEPVSRPYLGEPNGYVWGWCTWHVKNKRPDIGGYWGNAGYNWIASAQAAGFQTGYTPRGGAIAVQAGHVAYVEYVAGNMVYISEMGWNYTQGAYNERLVPASNFQYIY